MEDGLTGKVTVHTESDGRIERTVAPSARELVQTRLALGPVKTGQGGRRQAGDTVVPVATTSERISRNVLDKSETLVRCGAPRTLVAVADTRRPVETPTSASSHHCKLAR